VGKVDGWRRSPNCEDQQHGQPDTASV